MFGTYQGEHTRIPLLLLSLGASFGGWIFFFFHDCDGNFHLGALFRRKQNNFL